MASAVLDDGGAGEDAGEGFKEGGSGYEGESFGVPKSAKPECDLINTIHRRRGSPGACAPAIH